MTVVAAPAEKLYPVPPRLLSGKGVPTPFVNSMEQYQTMWEESVNEPNKFFGNVSFRVFFFFMCKKSHSFYSLLVNYYNGQNLLKLFRVVVSRKVILLGFWKVSLMLQSTV